MKNITPYCVYCLQAFAKVAGEDKLKAMQAEIQSHVISCPKNPLVIKLAEWESLGQNVLSLFGSSGSVSVQDTTDWASEIESGIIELLKAAKKYLCSGDFREDCKWSPESCGDCSGELFEKK